MAVARKKKLTENQQRLQRSGAAKAGHRGQWERTDGRERMIDIRGLIDEKAGKEAAERGLNYTPGGYTRGQLYATMGYTEAMETGLSESDMIAHDDQLELPGVENLDAAPRSAIDSAEKRGATRWEDLSPRDQEDIQRRVRARSGADLESMTAAYGAQLDQAVFRAVERGQSPPNFYTAGEPREVLDATARETETTPGLVAALHADNSPNAPFKMQQAKTGRMMYPQDEMARGAINAVRSGVNVDDDRAVTASKPPGVPGYDANYRKSVRRAAQVIDGGTPAGQTNPNKGSGFGPKTGPYQRAWVRGVPSQFVSDVHSGGGGMVPHQDFRKPITGTDENGDPVYGSSARETTVATGGFHLLADKAARDAHRVRGLHVPVKRGQEAQWVEEQIQRPDITTVTEETVYEQGELIPKKYETPDLFRGYSSKPPEDRAKKRVKIDMF